jgi:hypothetical protein
MELFYVLFLTATFSPPAALPVGFEADVRLGAQRRGSTLL